MFVAGIHILPFDFQTSNRFTRKINSTIICRKVFCTNLNYILHVSLLSDQINRFYVLICVVYRTEQNVCR